MMARIEFDTREFSEDQAHALVAAAYGGRCSKAPSRGGPTEDELRQAKELLELSESPVWKALMATLERDAKASIPEVAARAGKTAQGVLVAVGRAVQGRYSDFDWTWGGKGVQQTVEVTQGLREALLQVQSHVFPDFEEGDE